MNLSVQHQADQPIFGIYNYTWEYPGFWQSHIGTLDITIAGDDGGVNNIPYQVQISRDGEFVTGDDGHPDAKTAIMAAKELRIEVMADAFSKHLKKLLGARKLDRVKILNSRETSKDICHSHDFCDANMVMHHVFVEFVNAEGVDGDNEEHVDTWNAAWDRAAVKHLGRKA